MLLPATKILNPASATAGILSNAIKPFGFFVYSGLASSLRKLINAKIATRSSNVPIVM